MEIVKCQKLVDGQERALAVEGELAGGVKIKVTKLTGWEDVRRAAFATMWKCGEEVADKEPSEKWKRAILLARHSPIESLMFRVELRGIPSWVSVHLVRHKIGVTHYVSSQRDDRHTNPKPREEMPQGTPINHTMVLNAQAVIAISKKRLCSQASRETCAVWSGVEALMRELDPAMAWAMNPECWWCGGLCPEMKPCGRCPSMMAEYEKQQAEMGVL